MGYHIDEDRTKLGDLRKRLEATDLIPSHQPLLDGIGRNFAALEKAGCTSLRALRTRLKNAKAIAALAKDADVDACYLSLLRRVVEGFFPKPQPLSAFDWLKAGTLAKLKKAGITNTEQLHLAGGPAALTKKTRLTAKELSKPVALADLSRVQWVSPTFARVLVAAGFDRAAKIARAEPEALCKAVETANENARFYKGKVGLRDVKRLIVAASYVPGA